MKTFTGNQQRFSRYVGEKSASGCRLWTGGISANGYGNFRMRHGLNWYSDISAHRAAWLFQHGEIPAGKMVCHKCDVRNCVNVDHLFLGTALDNAQDRDRKGRYVPPSTANRQRGDNHTSRTHPENLVRGTAHHQAKITENEVLIIRASTMKGVELARIYGLAPITVSRIRRRMIWRHVP
jgi:hypothetical protein